MFKLEFGPSYQGFNRDNIKQMVNAIHSVPHPVMLLDPQIITELLSHSPSVGPPIVTSKYMESSGQDPGSNSWQ